MSKDHGGSAFPVPLNPGERYDVHGPADGMTLRDYFAAKAMIGQLSYGQCRDMSPDAIAGFSYEYADAMLKERAK